MDRAIRHQALAFRFQASVCLRTHDLLVGRLSLDLPSQRHRPAFCYIQGDASEGLTPGMRPGHSYQAGTKILSTGDLVPGPPPDKGSSGKRDAKVPKDSTIKKDEGCINMRLYRQLLQHMAVHKWFGSAATQTPPRPHPRQPSGTSRPSCRPTPDDTSIRRFTPNPAAARAKMECIGGDIGDASMSTAETSNFAKNTDGGTITSTSFPTPGSSATGSRRPADGFSKVTVIRADSLLSILASSPRKASSPGGSERKIFFSCYKLLDSSSCKSKARVPRPDIFSVVPTEEAPYIEIWH
ncbi:hypothetical protein MKZ38_007632 [Zalerion maritima]|uniref:Uncharacterized protein n=1 Tax=Zalerion maritima TaxID=339359 RepID=A0AAD5RYJ2_9PEZI|nr:hypothetical protein MKZ38_007632 [Zalerion maritima]